MFNINRTNLENLSKAGNAKMDPGSSNSNVFDSFKLTICNIVEKLSTLSIYDMCHWITHIDRWINNQTYQNTRSYGRGTIVNLDLGAQNFRYEPSYTHPCIILHESRDTILVVPCSSKKYGKGYIDVIDATPADGFTVNTGVQIRSFRWVHKNRIISPVGRVSSDLLDKIDREMLKLIPTYKLETIKLNAKIESLQEEIDELREKLTKLQNT